MSPRPRDYHRGRPQRPEPTWPP